MARTRPSSASLSASSVDVRASASASDASSAFFSVCVESMAVFV